MHSKFEILMQALARFRGLEFCAHTPEEYKAAAEALATAAQEYADAQKRLESLLPEERPQTLRDRDIIPPNYIERKAPSARPISSYTSPY